ncbi:unnamed protein product [Colias eurytheme]|nr:unnamed protein product [Colias eurytheme]
MSSSDDEDMLALVQVVNPLMYLADGCSFKSLSLYFLRGKSTIRQIVYETCQILWEVLQPEFMPRPNTEKWLEVAQGFYTLWNLPNCVGSIDGKHIRIKKPANSGSEYINYKGYFSVVLMAVVDADGFVGEYGRNSDGRAFQVSSFGQLMQRGILHLPNPTPLPGEQYDVPFYFVGDEAFPLKNNCMKPYSRRQLTNDRRVFNNRLSRGRKSVECAFGMSRTKFQVLSTPVCCNPDKVDIIVQTMCILHNIIRIYDGKKSSPGIPNTLRGQTMNVSQQYLTNPQNIRTYLTNYFNERASIPSQNRHNV